MSHWISCFTVNCWFTVPYVVSMSLWPSVECLLQNQYVVISFTSNMFFVTFITFILLKLIQDINKIVLIVNKILTKFDRYLFLIMFQVALFYLMNLLMLPFINVHEQSTNQGNENSQIKREGYISAGT